jgi:biopolymer transport protein ExbD
MSKKLNTEELELNMTPMIDVVFQLIIFFVVTLRMEEAVNKEIKLEKSPFSAPIESQKAKSTMVIEIDNRGNVSMGGFRVPREILRGILKRRYAKQGEFPVLIRADRRTRHQDVRAVMDMCSEAGLWKINFAAIKEQRGK